MPGCRLPFAHDEVRGALRGINVGGKNLVSMARLREVLEELGYANIVTYIASGNVILRSTRGPDRVRREIEAALPTAFTLHSEAVAVLVLSASQLRAVVENRPKGFGDEPDRYHSDVIYLMGIDAAAAMAAFDPRTGVDTVWRRWRDLLPAAECGTHEEPPEQDRGQPDVPVDDDQELGHHDRARRARIGSPERCRSRRRPGRRALRPETPAGSLRQRPDGQLRGSRRRSSPARPPRVRCGPPARAAPL